MPGNCIATCFTSRFKSRRPPTLFDETLSNTTSNIRAADALDAAQLPSPAPETPSTGPVVQHAEEGTDSPHFKPAPQPPTPPSPPVSPTPLAHRRPPVAEIVPAGNFGPTLDGASEYNGDGPTPPSAITERSEPFISVGTRASVRGGYLPSSFVMHPPPAPPTPPLPPPPPVPPAHPKPSTPEILPAANIVAFLDGAGEYNGAPQTPVPAIAEILEPKLPEETEASVRGGYLPSADELDPPPPYSSSQSSFPTPTLPRSIYSCSECRQPFDTDGLLRHHSHERVRPEIAGRPYKWDKCCSTLDKGALLELHYRKCVGHGGAFIDAEPFKPKLLISRMMAIMGHKKSEGLGKDGAVRTTLVEAAVLPHLVGFSHMQDLLFTDIMYPPPTHLKAESGIELGDLTPAPASLTPQFLEGVPTVNRIPSLVGPALTTTEHGGSMNAVIPAKDTLLRFQCSHRAKRSFHAKYLRCHLLRNRRDVSYMCLLRGQKLLPQDIYTRHLQRCAESRVEHEEERGQAGINPSLRPGVVPKTPPLMSHGDIALPPSSSSEAAFSPDSLATGIVMTLPSNCGSGVQLSESTAVVLHERSNAPGGVILTGWPRSLPRGRRQPYFAYVSNLSNSQMARRCPNSYLHSSSLAMLRGWELLIAARGYASIRRVEDVEDKEAQERISEWAMAGRAPSIKEALEVELLLPDAPKILSR